MKRSLFETYSDVLRLYLNFSRNEKELLFLNKTKYSKIAGSHLHTINRMAQYFAGLFFKTFSRTPDRKILQQKNWMFVVSRNNAEALSFLQEKIPQAQYVTLAKDIPGYATTRIPLKLKWTHYYKLPVLLFWFKRKHPVFFKHNYWTVFYACGLYEEAIRVLKHFRPKSLIFSNDHNQDAIAFKLAAADLGIKTIYIQHASINSYFPPLDFDLSLLEGECSLEKYQSIGPVKGKIIRIGMPKFDAYAAKRNFSTEIKRVGVCTNLLDSPLKAYRIIESIHEAFPEMEIIFRAHPIDQRPLPEGKVSVKISNAKEESTFDYLTRVDLIIACNSSILLEACMMNVTPVYFRMEDEPMPEMFDLYGYVKNGVARYVPDYLSLIAYLESVRMNKPMVFGASKKYNEVIGTPDEGRSMEIAASEVQRFLSQL